MKILLNLMTVQNSEFDQGLQNKYPLGLLSILEYTRSRTENIEWKVIVGDLQIEDVEEFQPDLVGISLVSAFFTKGKKIIKEIHARNPSMPIVIGGVHITFYPEQLPEGNVIGIVEEGEKPFLELCKIWLEKQAFHPDDLAEVPSLVYRDGCEIVTNSSAEGALAPEEVPVITCFDLVTFKKDNPVEFHIVTSRGCPYKCRFCSSSAFWKKIKYYPAETTVKQIKHIVDTYNPFLIHIFDDLMVADRKRLKEIHRLIRKENLHKKVSFACWATGNTYDDEMGTLLREMGVEWISFAIESGEPEIYSFLKGKWNSPDKTKLAIEKAHKKGFSVSTAIILGAPQESTKEMQISYDMVKSLPVTGGFVSVLKAYPGTTLWKEAVNRGIVCDEMDEWTEIELNDLTNPKTRFLGEAASREETLHYYRRFKELFEEKGRESKKRRLIQYISRPNILMKRVRYSLQQRLGR